MAGSDQAQYLTGRAGFSAELHLSQRRQVPIRPGEKESLNQINFGPECELVLAQSLDALAHHGGVQIVRISLKKYGPHMGGP